MTDTLPDTADTTDSELPVDRATLPERPLMELIDVSKEFHVRADGRRATLSAVNGVSLQVKEGRTLGIVGESGCGKSTLARLITGLHPLTSGDMIFDRKAIPRKGRRSREVVEQMQMVFQDPSSALNPRSTIGDSIAFPLQVQGRPRKEIDERVTKVIADVGLPANYADSYPHQLSGGQRQRVNIARALALQPRMIVLDEAVSALDKSIQAQVLNLLTDLQRDYQLTYVFISHDLNVVEYISDEVAVMYLGQVVEYGNAAEMWHRPLHPYTRLLMGSIPSMDPADSTRDQPISSGTDKEIPSPINPPSGCRFRTRCPFAMDVCAAEAPRQVVPLVPPRAVDVTIGSRPDGALDVKPESAEPTEHLVACHLYEDGKEAPDLDALEASLVPA